MSYQIVKLTFKSPVHFGRGHLSDSEFTCDAATLFSALFIEAMSVGYSDELLCAVKSGALAFSDAFPYVGDELYVPAPIGSVVAESVVDESATVENAVAGNTTAGDAVAENETAGDAVVGNTTAGDAVIGNASNLSEPNLSSGYIRLNFPLGTGEVLDESRLGIAFLRTKINLSEAQRTKVNLNMNKCTSSAAGNPETQNANVETPANNVQTYHVGGFAFKPKCGIYFIVKSTELPFNLEHLFESLGYSGIGGKRSSGYGRFEVSFESADVFDDTLTCNFENKGLLLSSALPSKEEFEREFLALGNDFLSGAKYKLVKKREMYLFAPGSVFEHSFAGDVFDVNTNPAQHPVYRYARALWLEV